MKWTSTKKIPPAYKRILLWWPYWSNHPVVGYFDNLENRWIANEAISSEGDGPTHWMSLPEPPGGR
jgi:hypothetical protein